MLTRYFAEYSIKDNQFRLPKKSTPWLIKLYPAMIILVKRRLQIRA